MSESGHRVLTIGAAGLDMKVTPKEATHSARSNPARIHLGWGGVARNVAENLACLGADVQLITAVGSDLWGEKLLEYLNAMGINTDYTLITSHTTGAYVAIYHKEQGLWLAFDDMELNHAVTSGFLYRHRRLFRDADMVCVDANLSREALAMACRLADKYKVPLCADPTAALLTHRLRPHLASFALLTPDKAEAEALLGQTLADDEAIAWGARQLVREGVGLAVITLGAAGLYYATSEESGRLPSLPVDVVDATGAGDALTAAIAYGLLEGVSPGEAVRLGLAAAALTLSCSETVCPTLSLERLYELLV